MNVQRLPATSRRQSRGHRDHGGAAVEMALVMPLLLLMIFGIIDFSRMFNAEIQLSQAAREGVRLAALRPQVTATAMATADTYAIQDRAILAAPHPAFGAALVRANVLVAAPYCVAKPLATDFVTVTVNYTFSGIGPWFHARPLQQKAVMRCGG